MRGSLEKKRGFTLVEIIISMLLLSTIVAGMLVVFVVGRRSVGLAGHNVQAMDFARETVEDLKGKVGGYLWPPDIPGRTDLDAGDHTTDALTGELATLRDPDITPEEQRTYTVEKNVAGPGSYDKVTVTVTWTEP